MTTELNEEQQAPKKKRRTWLYIVGAALLLCCGVSVLIGIFADPETTADELAANLESSALADEDTARNEDEDQVDSAIESTGDEEQSSPVESDEAANSSDPTAEPEPTKPPTATPEPTNTPIPTATADPNLLRPGTYIVGEDIQPGIYRGETGFGTFDECYWARLSGLSGEFDDIIANGSGYGQYFLEIKDSDVAVETACEITSLDSLSESVGEIPTTFNPGTYLVNRDIQPGIYRGEAGQDIFDECYWSRLSDVSGEFDGILANGSHKGQFYFEVKDGDFAVETRCEITLLDTVPAPETLSTSLLPGMYIIGRDISAGRYRGEGGEDILDACYWSRLSNASGEFGGIIANGSNNGQFFVEVSANDFALETNCELELVE